MKDGLEIQPSNDQHDAKSQQQVDNQSEHRKEQQAETDVLIYRCLKTACHELCHVIGITHCKTYECLMNGSNLIEEADRKPFLLCPVCQRKAAHYFNQVDSIPQRFSSIAVTMQAMGNSAFDIDLERIQLLIRQLELGGWKCQKN